MKKCKHLFIPTGCGFLTGPTCVEEEICVMCGFVRVYNGGVFLSVGLAESTEVIVKKVSTALAWNRKHHMELYVRTMYRIEKEMI